MTSIQSTKSVQVYNADCNGRFVLVCEHATNRIPEYLQQLGLEQSAVASHIAWDPGALDVAVRLSELLKSPLLAAGYSRLVCDCNRNPNRSDLIVDISDDTVIPGNRHLSAEEREARVARIHRPFHDAIHTLIEQRKSNGRPPILVTVHSFTQYFEGSQRDYDVGVIHDEDDQLASRLIARMRRSEKFSVRQNEPYGPQDGVTYTLVRHGLQQRLLHAMIEIRNDIIDDEIARQSMAEWLADCLNGMCENGEMNKDGA